MIRCWVKPIKPQVDGRLEISPIPRFTLGGSFLLFRLRVMRLLQTLDFVVNKALLIGSRLNRIGRHSFHGKD